MAIISKITTDKYSSRTILRLAKINGRRLRQRSGASETPATSAIWRAWDSISPLSRHLATRTRALLIWSIQFGLVPGWKFLSISSDVWERMQSSFHWTINLIRPLLFHDQNIGFKEYNFTAEFKRSQIIVLVYCSINFIRLNWSRCDFCSGSNPQETLSFKRPHDSV